MYVYDIETLGIGETSVILSMGCIYVESTEPQTFEQLKSNSIFIKLDAKHQIEVLKRTVDKDTIDWWSKQTPAAKNASYAVNGTEVDPVMAFQQLRQFTFSNTQQHRVQCFTRGFMDVTTSEHLAKQVGEKFAWQYNDFRDVRTAIDLLYPKSKNGYVDVNPSLCIGFGRGMIEKHNPVDDCVLDAAMILYGKTE